MSGFVHLHVHSTWSLLDGCIPAETLAHVAALQGFTAIALTDHDALTGAVRFTRACRQAGIRPLYGAELTLDSEEGARGEPEWESQLHPRRSRGRLRPGFPQSEHITVLARNRTGYANLCRLISAAHLNNKRGHPATSFAALAERAEGLFVLSGCARGEVARLAAKGHIDEAVVAARRWRDVFGNGYRIEVFDHRGYGDRALRDRLLAVARATGIRAVATNNVHYAVRGNAVVHELLHAIKDIVPLSRSQALRPTAEHYLKDAAEMRALFADCSEVCDETVAVAEACEFELDLDVHHFPQLEQAPGLTPAQVLAARCYQGAHRRYGSVPRAVEERLQHELQMMFRMGFAAYFLLVADIVDDIRGRLGVRCACRGSAAGSLVCYLLGISDVDPVRYDLLFERFMNTRREEMPDIDVDVESHRREEVLDTILKTYGSDQTALCCMVDTFRARGAIRDVGKALGLPPDEIDVVAKSFPHIGAGEISLALERLPELKNSNLKSGRLATLFALCEEIDGFPRHLALHPSGVILSSKDLADRVPMQESFGGFAMLQADKNDVEDLGLVKLDVLGVRMLSAITHATSEIARTHNRQVDLDALPRDDEATFKLIRSSNTIGCFQIESPGQRELLARLQPNRFEDLIVDISLFRPGPVQSDMVSPYLQRRHGFETLRYPHESLRDILKETNGIIVFHEQLIRVIARATGCSLDDADFVRRHLDSERPARPDDPDSRPPRKGIDGPRSGVPADNEVGAWFVERALKHGFSPQEAGSLWREVYAFASFGFCKSHAAAFALPTYQSAWLKAHHPAEFYAGLLTHDPGMYPRRLIVADARRNGVLILPVDINLSGRVYRVESSGGRPGVRLALSEVRDISAAEIDALLAARDRAPFGSLEDCWRRAAPSRPVLENLVHVGAFDALEERGRRELLWRALRLRQPQAGAGRQLSLNLTEAVPVALPELPDYTPVEETEAELEITSMDARRHVMDLYRPLLADLGCTPPQELPHCRNNSTVWVAGVKVASQTPAIRSGQRIIFVTLDDLTGPIDVTVFERAQAHYASTVFHCWLLLVKGVVRKRGGASLLYEMDPVNVGLTVVAEEVFDLAEVARSHRDHSLGSAPSKLWHASGGSAG